MENRAELAEKERLGIPLDGERGAKGSQGIRFRFFLQWTTNSLCGLYVESVTHEGLEEWGWGELSWQQVQLELL